MPALFGLATDDVLVKPEHHGELLYAKYAGPKQIIRFEKGEARLASFLEAASTFIKNAFEESESPQKC